MAYDPLRHRVKSLLQFSGADGSTAIVDGLGKAWSAFGNAQVDADGGPFGEGCLLLDGSGDYITSPAATDWNLGTSDFTYEVFFKPAAPGASIECLFTTRGASSTGIFLDYSSSGIGVVAWTGAGSTIISLGFVGTILTSYNHAALSRVGSNFYLALNGAIAATAISAASIGNAAGVAIGRDTSGSGPRYMNGRVAQSRLTLGAGRYVSSYALPTEPFELRGTRVSGTVQKGDPASPAKRKILIVRTADLELVGSGFSDPDDGSYEIETGADVDESLMGLAYPDYGEPPIRSHVYVVGDRTWVGAPAPLGHWYECEQAGTTGSTAPTWPTDGSTVTDGTVIWRDKGVMERPWAEGPYIAEAV